jgi:hypothetical protein
MQHARLLAAVVLATLGSTIAACDDDDLTDIDEEATYTASLTPDLSVNPLGTPTATGGATLELDDGDFRVVITINGPLTSRVTGARIHGPATLTSAAPVVFDLTPRMAEAINAGATTGTILNAEYDLEEMEPVAGGELRVSAQTLVDMLNNGTAYVSVSTVDNPLGELRGQVVRR